MTAIPASHVNPVAGAQENGNVPGMSELLTANRELNLPKLRRNSPASQCARCSAITSPLYARSL